MYIRSKLLVYILRLKLINISIYTQALTYILLDTRTHSWQTPMNLKRACSASPMTYPLNRAITCTYVKQIQQRN